MNAQERGGEGLKSAQHLKAQFFFYVTYLSRKDSTKLEFYNFSKFKCQFLLCEDHKVSHSFLIKYLANNLAMYQVFKILACRNFRTTFLKAWTFLQKN